MLKLKDLARCFIKTRQINGDTFCDSDCPFGRPSLNSPRKCELFKVELKPKTGMMYITLSTYEENRQREYPIGFYPCKECNKVMEND